jgi:hypothetical protein
MVPERAHNLFIRTRAKNGFKLLLTNFKISKLETKDSLQSKGLITRRSLVQIQPPLPIYFQSLTQKSTPKEPITRSLAPHIGGIYDHYSKRDGVRLSVNQKTKELKPQHKHFLQPASQQVLGVYGVRIP